ncbi:MAG TPA: L,D-transpeptidase [Kiritimatiellia bacterium]|nr:L,D-transpeptidase [Kiritimatiellia bacterium]
MSTSSGPERPEGRHRLWVDALGRGMPEAGWLLVVDVDAQRMDALRGGEVRASYAVSTSAHGLGDVPGSFKTPPGWMRVVERYGQGLPPGTEFSSRQVTGRIWPESAWRGGEDKDRILSRILWLDAVGGDGRDSFKDRTIYLHGTNHEELLGTPASHGCIRMANRDIVELDGEIGDDPVWCWVGCLADLCREG